MSTENKQCCPEFDPKPWDEKFFEWKNKAFVKERVFCLYYMPINFGSAMMRLSAKFEKAGYKYEGGPCLTDHTSKWNMNLYVEVDKEIPETERVYLSGKYLSKVYEGPFKNTGIWCNDFEKYAKEKNLIIEKWYMWYTTCPKCSKKYGKNYVVIIAKVK